MLTLAFALFASTAHAAVDADGDGFDTSSDCDDLNAAVNPGATEVADGLDNDCDGTVDEGTGGGPDSDGDGYSPAAGDCDDGEKLVHPGATEVCNGRDDNCDGTADEGITADTWYADADGDGFGDPGTGITQCSGPAGYVHDNTDCDDGSAAVHPGATEVEADGIDQDCDGTDAGGTGADTGDTADTGAGGDTSADSGADTSTADTGDTGTGTTHTLCATTPGAALPFAGALAVFAAFARRKRR